MNVVIGSGRPLLQSIVKCQRNNSNSNIDGPPRRRPRQREEQQRSQPEHQPNNCLYTNNNYNGQGTKIMDPILNTISRNKRKGRNNSSNQFNMISTTVMIIGIVVMILLVVENSNYGNPCSINFVTLVHGFSIPLLYRHQQQYQRSQYQWSNCNRIVISGNEVSCNYRHPRFAKRRKAMEEERNDDNDPENNVESPTSKSSSSKREETIPTNSVNPKKKTKKTKASTKTTKTTLESSSSKTTATVKAKKSTAKKATKKSPAKKSNTAPKVVPLGSDAVEKGSKLPSIVNDNINDNNYYYKMDDEGSSSSTTSRNVLNDDGIDDNENNDDYNIPVAELPGEEDIYGGVSSIDASELQTMSISQLQQQLRLRGWKVSGRKDELIDRLLQRQQLYSDDEDDDDIDLLDDIDPGKDSGTKNKSKMNKNEPIDVTAYLDDEDQGKEMKSMYTKSSSKDDVDVDATTINPVSKNPEIWGIDAKIIDNYEGRQLIVDNLSRMIIEYTGSNQTSIPAYVVASRDALRPYLAGGSLRNRNYKNNKKGNNDNNSNNEKKVSQSRTYNVDDDDDDDSKNAENSFSNDKIIQSSKQRVIEIQTQREQEQSVRPTKFLHDEYEIVDEGDENRIITDIVLNRDYSDWGIYTPTGEQISASEVPGVILLSDVYGAFSPDTQALAEKIAFECQPIVVMVPDLFDGTPWNPIQTANSSTNDNDDSSNEVLKNARGQTYEEWRESIHDEIRIHVNIRAAAACLRERYGVSSITLFGTCYGGGRALEVGSGYLPSIHDVDGITIGPPPVNPATIIAWYPTRYMPPSSLFGPNRIVQSYSSSSFQQQKQPNMTLMCVFAENDTIPGATKKDAAELKSLLEKDDRVKDHMIKVFPGQGHGFAHIGLSSVGQQQSDDNIDELRFINDEFGGAGKLSLHEGDAEVACLLSTAFMETYSRVFLPTVGTPISLDENNLEWNQELIMNKDITGASRRDIRAEIDEAVHSYVEEPLESGPMIDPTDPNQEDQLAQILRSMASPEQQQGKYKILDDDDLPAIYAKLTAADNDFQIF